MVASTDKGNDRRVIIFLPRQVHTGGEQYLVEVFDYLRRQEIPVEPVYLQNSKEAKKGLLLMIDILFANLRFFRRIRRLGNLSNAIFFEDFHLHPRLWLFNELVRLTTKQLRMVTIVQLSLSYHGALRNRLARVLDAWLVCLFFRQASVIFTNSEFTRREVLSTGVSPGKIRVIYCGCKAMSPTQLLERGDREASRLLFVGQCAEYKGLEYLIRAMPLLSDPSVTLDVVGNTQGEPDYYARLVALVGEFSLQDRIVFHGHVSDRAVLGRFYEHADIFVLPSLVEGFGIVLLEAMSYGLPIVGTMVGAIPELVMHGVNGFLVPPANPAALAEAISRLLDSVGLRKQCGQAGHRFVVERREFYSWEAVGERALEAMKPLLVRGNDL